MPLPDRAFALVTVYRGIESLQRSNTDPTESKALHGLASLLVDAYSGNYDLVGSQCYREVFRLQLKFHEAHADFPPDELDADRDDDGDEGDGMSCTGQLYHGSMCIVSVYYYFSNITIEELVKNGGSMKTLVHHRKVLPGTGKSRGL